MYTNLVTQVLDKLDNLGVAPELVNKRHGGPYDRGSADAWYDRGCDPHYYVGASISTSKVPEDMMSETEILEYELGYYEGMASGDHKEW
jgi:hypothetical protein